MRKETEADDGRCTKSQLESLLDKMFRGYTVQLKMTSVRERASTRDGAEISGEVLLRAATEFPRHGAAAAATSMSHTKTTRR